MELCGGTYGESQANKRFFPYEYIPETIETAFCAVCFDIATNHSYENSTFTDVVIMIWVMCHVDIAIMENEPGLRYDLVAHEILRDWANQDFMGIGKMQIAYNHVYTATPTLRGRALQIGVFDISPEAYARHARFTV